MCVCVCVYVIRRSVHICGAAELVGAEFPGVPTEAHMCVCVWQAPAFGKAVIAANTKKHTIAVPEGKKSPFH